MFRLLRALVGSKLLVDSTTNLGSLEHIESGALQRTLSQVLHYFFSTKITPPPKKKNKLWVKFWEKNSHRN